MMRGWIVLPALCLAGFFLAQPSARRQGLQEPHQPELGPRRLPYVVPQRLGKGAREYVLVDLKKGTREPAFDQEKLSSAS